MLLAASRIRLSGAHLVLAGRNRQIADHSPGDRVTVSYRRRDGTRGVEDLTLPENPEIRIVPIEETGCSLSEAQQRFRNDRLGSRAC
jgi:hypothetical protein